MLDVNGNDKMVDIRGNPVGVGDIVIVMTGGEKGTHCVVRSVKGPQVCSVGGHPNTFQAGPRKGQFKPGHHMSEWRCRIDDDVTGQDADQMWKFSMWAGCKDVCVLKKAGR